MSTSPKPADRHAAPIAAAALPHDLDAEQGLLGSMLIAPHEVCPLVERMPPDAFHLPAHRTIVRLLLAAHRDGCPMDLITLTDALRRSGHLDSVGGAAYLSHLLTATPTAANARWYAEIIEHAARLRSIHLTAAAVAELALTPQAAADELSERLQQLLVGMARAASTGSDVATMAQLVPEAIARMEARYEGRGRLRGISSGLGLLDRLTGGWQPGQMIVIAAREKEGKSSLARQLVLEAAVGKEVPTAIFSHEMGREQIVDAMIVSRARVNPSRIEDGTISEAEFLQIGRAMPVLAAAPIFIFDEADASVLQFRANARRAVREHGCRLIVLDYLQLVAGSERVENREQAVSEVARHAKLAAKELDVPIIVLSQLNAEGVTQYARAVQQHLDTLIVIEHENPEAEGDGKAWIKVKLQRGGPKGSVPVMWRPAFTRFDALAAEQPS